MLVVFHSSCQSEIFCNISVVLGLRDMVCCLLKVEDSSTLFSPVIHVRTLEKFAPPKSLEQQVRGN